MSSTLLLNLEHEATQSAQQLRHHPAFLTADGRPCHISKVYKAFANGLEHFRGPGGIRSSKEAVIRWLEKLNGLEGEPASRPVSVRRAQVAVDRSLDECGIC